MKSFGRYSVRGLILIVIGCAGILVECFWKLPRDIFVIFMYGIVICIGLILLTVVRSN